MRTKYPTGTLWRARYGTAKLVRVYIRDGQISESGMYWTEIGKPSNYEGYFETEAEAIACLFTWQRKRIANAHKEIKSAETALKKLRKKYPVTEIRVESP